MRREPLALVDDQPINIRDMPDLLEAVGTALECGDGFTLLTLNLDHLVKRRENPRFRELYARATFVTADGWPVVQMARRRAAMLERTAGADLVIPLCRLAARQGVPVAFFGSTVPILEKAAVRLRQLCPGLDVVACEAPPFGFDPLGEAALKDARSLADKGARLVFVALGAPKQEIFSDHAFEACPTLGFVCIGAALDFIAGAQIRAPLLLQQLRLEWAWRLALQPKRLGLRYLRCVMLYAELLLRGDTAGASRTSNA